MRLASLSRMIAPSILASSRSPVAENGTSRVKPPLEIDSTVLSVPSTISAPVRPRRIRSSPSRSGVPGATLARVARSRSCSSERSGAATCTPAVVRDAVSASLGRRCGGRPCGRALRSSTRSAVRRSGAAQHLHAVDLPEPPPPQSGGHDRVGEADARAPRQPALQLGDPAQLAGQPDLADRDHLRRDDQPLRGRARWRARWPGRRRARGPGRRRPWRRRRRGEPAAAAPAPRAPPAPSRRARGRRRRSCAAGAPPR